MREREDLDISIVIACYNYSSFLKDAFISVFKQDTKKWEIIFVDDCSSDQSLDVAYKLVNEYGFSEKVKFIRHESRLGYGKSLYDGIDAASGKLIAILDADDALATSRALSIMISEHRKKKNASLTYSDYIVCDVDLKPYRIAKGTRLLKGQKLLTREKYYGNVYEISHFKVFKKCMYEKTEKVDPSLVKGVDKDLILKLEEVGDLVYVDVILYLYRRHDSSITSVFRTLSESERDIIYKQKLEMLDKARKRRGWC